MTLQGTYKRTIYKDIDTGYTIFEVFTIDGFAVKCVGICPHYSAGMPLTITGEKTPDAFQCQSIEECGNDVKLTKKYFASALFGKMSPSNAANLALLVGNDLFGFMEQDDAIDKIMLATKKNREWAEKIVRTIQDTNVQREIWNDISKAGGTIADMTAIYKKYGKSAWKKMKKNPYDLLSIKGISFAKCDKLAALYQIQPDDENRLRALLHDAMQSVYSSGSTRITWNRLWNKVRYRIENSAFPSIRVSKLLLIKILVTDKRYKIENGYITEQWMSKLEQSIANDILRLLKYKSHYHITNDDIMFIEDELGVQYDDSQKQIFTIANEGVVVLTGPPGSGKTSTIKGLIRALQLNKLNIQIVLGATTGCAARHFADSTGLDAETVERLLKPCAETGQFTFNRYNQIEADVIIIDEYSMSDTKQTAKLLEAIKNGTLLLLVGDIDQLKSVGPGKVLEDLINCGKIPVVRLNTFHRQKGGSIIPANAMKVNAGALPLESDGKSCTFYQAYNDDHALQIMQWILDTELKNKSLTAYSLLSVIKKGTIGTNALNDYIYNMIFQQAPSFRYGKYKFSKNERIMLTENNYKLGYCNGDMGFVIGYDAEGIEVKLDHAGEEIYLSAENLDDLVPAYAKTVHKAQGSENENVILLLSNSMKNMLNREILYTGMTRAKSRLWVVFVQDALIQCVQNTNTKQRNTGLLEKLQNS